MRFQLVNESTVVTTTQAKAIVAALKLQAPQVGKAWQRYEWTITYQTSIDKVAPDAIPVVILDDADQADALAYHDVDPHGRPYCRVFAKTILNAGGTILTGSLSVSAATSHEVIEAFCDPPALFWSEKGGGGLIALEACDPCQDIAYELNGVAVSDFCLPAFFSPLSPGPYTFRDSIGNPGGLSKGGYLIVAIKDNERQVYGRIPPWKSARSRSHQRLEAPLPDTIDYPEAPVLAKLNQYRKALTVFVTGNIGWAATVIASPAAHVTASEWLALAIVNATALGVYAVPNASTP